MKRNDRLKRRARPARAGHPGRWHRGAAALAGLALLAVAGCGGSAPSPQPSASGTTAGFSQRSGVTGGALFGGDVPLVPQSANLSRKLAIVRVYFRLGHKFPVRRDNSLMAAGSTLLVSLDDLPGPGAPSYADIAAGKYDSVFTSVLAQLEQSAVRYHLPAIYFTFEHEANSPQHRPLGSPAEFVKAWDHVHQLAVSAHLNWNQGGRLHWVWILTHLAYEPLASRPSWAKNAGAASSYWPGSNVVDIIGADGYNSGSCRSASPGTLDVASGSKTVTPQQLFGPVVTFAQSHGNLPVFIAEWGSVPYSGSAEQSSFITQMQSFVSANHDIAAALYWNSQDQTTGGCNYRVTNQPASVSALKTMAHSPALQGRLASSG